MKHIVLSSSITTVPSDFLSHLFPSHAGKVAEVTCVCAACDKLTWGTPQVKYNPEHLLDLVHSHHTHACPGTKREAVRKAHSWGRAAGRPDCLS